MDGGLLGKAIQGEEAMREIKTPLLLTVAVFGLAVVPGSVGGG